MDISMQGQTALITGASRGLGRYLCKSFAAAGANVAAVARSETDLSTLKEEIDPTGQTIETIPASVSDFNAMNGAVHQTLKRWKSIDVLVNNAGTSIKTSFEDLTKEEIDTVIDVNLKGLIYTTRLVVPQMLRQRSGTIFNISSIASTRGLKGNGLYFATKFGVNGFGESLSKYLMENNIHVVTLCPGGIDTTWWDRSEYKYDKKLLIKPADIAKLMETVLTLPKNVLFQKVIFFPTCEVERW